MVSFVGFWCRVVLCLFIRIVYRFFDAVYIVRLKRFILVFLKGLGRDLFSYNVVINRKFFIVINFFFVSLRKDIVSFMSFTVFLYILED